LHVRIAFFLSNTDTTALTVWLLSPTAQAAIQKRWPVTTKTAISCLCSATGRPPHQSTAWSLLRAICWIVWTIPLRLLLTTTVSSSRTAWSRRM